jgi:hypothetical protein
MACQICRIMITYKEFCSLSSQYWSMVCMFKSKSFKVLGLKLPAGHQTIKSRTDHKWQTTEWAYCMIIENQNKTETPYQRL